MLFLIVFYIMFKKDLIYNYKQKKDMPIVKQPSKLITASGHKSFLNKKLQFSNYY
jgi:hypothetical protein